MMISFSSRVLIATALAIATTHGIASERLDDGGRAYKTLCATCHESGTAGAPVTGNKEDWADRSNLWEAVLFEHADKGYINMPARGNVDHATQYDVEAAAEYMLTITHPEMPRD